MQNGTRQPWNFHARPIINEVDVRHTHVLRMDIPFFLSFFSSRSFCVHSVYRRIYNSCRLENFTKKMLREALGGFMYVFEGSVRIV